MTTITITTPVEVDINLDEHLPVVSTRLLLAELNERFVDNITITRAQFLDLADSIIEMRFRDAFHLMEAVAPLMLDADKCQARQLEHVLEKAKSYPPTQEAAQ